MIKNSHAVTTQDGTVYHVRDSVSAGDGLRWIERYWPENLEQDAPEIPKTAAQAERSVLRCIASRMEDFDFLAGALIINVKPCDIPLKHVPELIGDLRKSLHIGDFIVAMSEGMKPEGVSTSEGTEKN